MKYLNGFCDEQPLKLTNGKIVTESIAPNGYTTNTFQVCIYFGSRQAKKDQDRKQQLCSSCRHEVFLKKIRKISEIYVRPFPDSQIHQSYASPR